MAKSDPTKDAEFKRVLGNLLSAPPKPHSEMKLGKPKPSTAKSRRKEELRQKVKVKNLEEAKATARAIRRPEE